MHELPPSHEPQRPTSRNASLQQIIDVLTERPNLAYLWVATVWTGDLLAAIQQAAEKLGQELPGSLLAFRNDLLRFAHDVRQRGW